MNQWVELLKFIGSQVYEKVKNIVGSDKAKEVIGEGEFGDNTVYIDKLAEDTVIDLVCKSNMACSILTEEKGWIEVKGKYPIVIVDPIDGSLNAKRGIPYYALSIGVAFDNTTDSITCGYVINLSNKDEFWAVKGEGTYFNGKRVLNKKHENLGVIAVEGLKKETDHNVLTKIFESFYRVRQSGSTALDLCYTAIYSYDAFLHLDKARIVDYAAGKIIVEEAGGGLFKWMTDDDFKVGIDIDKTVPFIAVPYRGTIHKVIGKLR